MEDCIIGFENRSVFVINHGLNTKNVIVQIYDNEDGTQSFCGVRIIDEYSVELSFTMNLGKRQYRVVIK